jgi:thiamine biosynthesis lipoprotein
MLTALLLLSAAAADPPARQFQFAEPHMGTRFQITLYAPDEATAKAAARAAFDRIAELDGIMSDYRATSELMQLCRKAGGQPVPVSADLFGVLKQSQALAKRTGGAFDVTVGPLTRLWRLSRRTQRLPAPDQLAQARALVGFDKVELDEANRSVRLATPGMQLDLGGIAKGYTADQTLLFLK